MYEIELKKVLLLVFILAAVALFIDRTRPYTPRPTIDPAKVPLGYINNQTVSNSTPDNPYMNDAAPSLLVRTNAVDDSAIAVQTVSAIPQPVVVRPMIWPGDVPPTKIIHIPDPTSPTTGIMDIGLQPGDEIEIDFEPLWLWTCDNLPSNLEYMLKRDGGNFQQADEYSRDNLLNNSGTNAWWAKSRIVRFRLKPSSRETTFRIVISKISDEAIKPLPSVPSQWSGDLRADFTKIQKLNNGSVQVDITFHNTSVYQTLAIAMYGDVCPFEPCPVSSLLTASDGTMCTLDTSGLTGIQCMHALPKKLAPIEPNGALNASFNFEPRGNFSSVVRSFRLEMQIAIDSSYSDNQFNYYQPTHDLPPYCKVVNLIFDIPVR